MVVVVVDADCCCGLCKYIQMMIRTNILCLNRIYVFFDFFCIINERICGDELYFILFFITNRAYAIKENAQFINLKVMIVFIFY